MKEETRLRSFHGRISRQDDGCWTWTGKVSAAGYGRVTIHGKEVMAHRFAYELWRGPIPSEMTIDHACRNRRCVNPDHLRPMTLAQNVMIGEGICARNARKTECKRGHRLTPENVYVDHRGGRVCRECRVMFGRRWRKTHPGYNAAHCRQYAWRQQNGAA